ncbi:MAG: hypothetical protein HQK55_01290 [Deltaproteobacteria bacterium]|nr:hypothetical protein [Deltaproteobacteria bacterium]
MLKLLWTAFKILLVLVLLGVLGVGLYLLVYHQKWPWWVGVVIFIGILGLILGVLFLKKWLFRRRERQFVQRIVEQDEAVMPKAPVGERQQIRDLEARWHAAMAILRRSQLRKHGDPIYVLPWYLLLGAPESGKSTALSSARLPAPLTEVSPDPEGGETPNCDWYFLENSVIMDTTGRYSMPVDEVLDREEWQRFLNLLVKYRRQEALNGVVVTVPADKLLTGSPDAVAEDARQLRRRIDELIRVLGSKFPAWIMVTKMDTMVGINALGNLLAEDVRCQAMGHHHAATRHEPRVFVEETMEVVTDRLKDMLLLLLGQNPSEDYALFLLPGELEKIFPNLRVFAETLFEENPYQETPLLRGIYFSSGRQNKEARSLILTGTETVSDLAIPAPNTEQGLFLSDFFSKILPADRNLLSPIREYLSWRRLTRNLGLTAWAAIIFFLCGLLSFSFVKNIKVLHDLTDDLIRPPVLTNNLEKDLILMDRYRTELLELEDNNKKWWMPRFGLEQTIDVENRLKKNYCLMFRRGLLDHLDFSLAKSMDGFTKNTPGEIIGAYVEHLQTRINLLMAAYDGASYHDLEKLPPPAYTAISLTDQKMLSEIAMAFGPLYISYLSWTPNRWTVAQELATLRNQLKHMADIRTTSMRWLVAWVNVQPDLKSVVMEDFWGQGRLDRAESVNVPPAYTRKGRDRIDEFVNRYRASLEDSKILDERLKEFDDWYWREYLMAWDHFGWSFDQGFILIGADDDRRAMAEVMADPVNPYYQLLDRMADELEPLYEREGIPVWVKSAVSFQKVKKQAAQQDVLKTANILTKTAEKGETLLKEAFRNPDAQTISRLEHVSKASEQLKAYEKALTDIIPVTSSREMAFKMASKFYPTASDGAQPEAKSPFQDANSALTKLKGTTLSVEARRDNLFWHLLYGPLKFLLAYTTHEAACELQLNWEGSVLATVADMPPDKVKTTLFDQEKGLAWKFVTGPAAPFIGRSSQGFYARSCLDQEFPFLKPFLGFLDMGASGNQVLLPEYQVNIKTRPVSVNRGALLAPYQVIVTLDCAQGPQTLDNYNYPASQDFKWQPDKCGTVTLKIIFSDFTLTGRYEGPTGFPDFLEDFRHGTKVFTPEDFPDQKDDLNNLRVSEIRLTYIITDSEPVRKLLLYQPYFVPQQITECYTGPFKNKDQDKSAETTTSTVPGALPPQGKDSGKKGQLEPVPKKNIIPEPTKTPPPETKAAPRSK